VVSAVAAAKTWQAESAAAELAAVGGDVGGGGGPRGDRGSIRDTSRTDGDGPRQLDYSGGTGGVDNGGAAGGVPAATLERRAGSTDTTTAAARQAAVQYGVSLVTPSMSSYGAYSHVAGSGRAPPPPSAVQAQQNGAVLAATAANVARAIGSRSEVVAHAPALLPAPSRRTMMPLGDDIDALTGIPKAELNGRANRAMQLRLNAGARKERGAMMDDPFDDEERVGNKYRTAQGHEQEQEREQEHEHEHEQERDRERDVERLKLELVAATVDDVPSLFKYIKQGRYDEAKALFKRGVSTSARDAFGNTPLIVACQNGQAGGSR